MSQPEPSERSAGGIPPFWIMPAGNGARSIDERVWKSAEAIWPSCFRHAQYCLSDGMVAAQILEGVAIDVSARLRRDEEVARNLRGYLMASFVHAVGAHAKRESRIQYRGLSSDLERALHPVAPDILATIEEELLLEALIAHMSPSGKQLLNFRLLGFSWKETAESLGITGKQARSRFYYSLEKAAVALLGPQYGRLPLGEPE